MGQRQIMEASPLNGVFNLFTHIVLYADLLFGYAQLMLRSRFIKECEDILSIEPYVVIWSDYI